MHIAPTAFSDPCRLSAFPAEDGAGLRLRLRGARPARRALLNLAAGIGLGGCLAMNAAAAATETAGPLQAPIVLGTGADIGPSGAGPAADPLQGIVPEPAAALMDAAAIQQQIIVSM